MTPTWLERLFFGQNIAYWSDLAHRLTKGKYLFAARPDVSKWQRWEHEITGWRHFVVPRGDEVQVFKFRRPVGSSEAFEWPELIREQRLGGTDYARVNMYGHISGSPIQRCGPETRLLTWGYAEYGKQEFTRIPIPEAGWWWLTGWPTPAYDKHWTGVAPDGTVHECIQLDPDAPATRPPFPNQALGWAQFRNGVKIAGDGATVLNLPASAYCWDFHSSAQPHELCMVISDYIGGDGTREAGSGWPIVGERYCLDRSSISFGAMRALGGECAVIAEAAASFGIRIIDRNGYTDVSGNAVAGLKPQGPHLHVQCGSQWGQTNISRLSIRLGDLRHVTS